LNNRQDIEISILKNLEDAGCEKHLIMDYIKCENNGRIQEQLCLLTKYRKVLLERIHEEQSRIDCLDYLIYKIKTNNKKRNNDLSN
jgi:hypothetical protein